MFWAVGYLLVNRLFGHLIPSLNMAKTKKNKTKKQLTIKREVSEKLTSHKMTTLGSGPLANGSARGFRPLHRHNHFKTDRIGPNLSSFSQLAFESWPTRKRKRRRRRRRYYVIVGLNNVSSPAIIITLMTLRYEQLSSSYSSSPSPSPLYLITMKCPTG